MIRGFLKTWNTVRMKFFGVNRRPPCSTKRETAVHKMRALKVITHAMLGKYWSPSMATASGNPSSPLLQKTHPVPKTDAPTESIFKNRIATNRQMTRSTRHAPKNAISRRGSVCVSLKNCCANRRNSMAVSETLKANLTTALLSVFPKPHQRTRAYPSPIKQKSGTDLVNWTEN